MDVIILQDSTAVAQLSPGDYYRWVREQSESVAALYGGSAGDDPWFHASEK